MTAAKDGPSLEDVLGAFGDESSPDRTTLERYLRRYPQFAAALIDLSRELNRSPSLETASDRPDDESRIEAAWSRHAAARPGGIDDPFASLSLTRLQNLAKTLDVPRQVITAFRDRKVIVASVPRRWLRRLADEISSSLERLVHNLSAPTDDTSALARSYKADNKPSGGGLVSFERILVDAGVPDDKRAELLAEDE